MADIQITANDQEVQRALDEVVRRVADPTDLMRQVADVLADATDAAFANEADPATGVAWDPLSAVTLALRPERQGGQILNASGAAGLKGSISTDYGKDFAEIGTNRVYAPTHQFGAEKGAFGKTSRGGPIPWGDIPARPFLGIGPEDETDILDLATEFLADAFPE